MENPQSGYEYLKKLREKNGGNRNVFNDFASYLENKARETGTPLSGQFELTPLCNLDCKMCYVHLEKAQLKGKPILSVEQWKHIMLQAVDAGMLYATLTGGECLAYPGFEELYLFLHSLGCSVKVLTNGLLLDERSIRFFQKNLPDGIQVTLYGCNDDVYERVTGRRVFQTVCEHVRMAVEAKLPMFVSITPSSFLGDDLCDTVRVAKSLCGAVSINKSMIIPREDTGRSGHQIEADLETEVKAFALLEELNGRKVTEIPIEKLPIPGGLSHECMACGAQCAAGRSIFTITWQGKMIPCNRLVMIESHPFGDGFAKAWSQINERVKRLPRVPECDGCPYESSCSKCAADLLRFAIPGKGPEKLCQRAIAFVRHGIWHIPGCE